MNVDQMILLILILPIVGGIGITLSKRWPNVRETVTLTIAVVLFFSVTRLIDPVLSGTSPSLTLLSPLRNLPIAFRIEPLGMLFGLLASGLWIVNSLYSIGYMRKNDEKHQTTFYVCFALAIWAALGLAFAANLLTLFLFYELLTLITYPLVTHAGTEEAKKAGRLYLGTLMGTSVLFLLPAIIYTWHVAGTTDFRPGGILPDTLSPGAVAVLLALFMFGIAKAAVMPLHRWLPAAMVAPTPVSALLHAVAVVKAGVFTVVKVIVYIFGIDLLAGTTGWLIALASFTILSASLIAFNSNNLKRRLAYSTISQLSYIILGAAILTPLSVVGAGLHIVTHALGKITLFFAAGSIYTAAHKTEVSQLDGIGRRMPWTMGAFAFATLSLIGIPPFVGFIGKWYIVSGAIEQAQWLALAIIIASTLLNAGYLLPIVHRAFFRPLSADDLAHPHGEAPLLMIVAIWITAVATIATFFYPEVFLSLVQAISLRGAS